MGVTKPEEPEPTRPARPGAEVGCFVRARGGTWPGRDFGGDRGSPGISSWRRRRRRRREFCGDSIAPSLSSSLLIWAPSFCWLSNVFFRLALALMVLDFGRVINLT